MMPEALAGDVIFIRGRDASTKASAFLQTRVDPDAASADHAFGHAAIVIDSLIALEAMPDEKQLKLGKAERVAEVGAWSGAALGSGTRLIPIADLIIPAVRENAGLTVMRASPPPEHFLNGEGAVHPAISPLIGSAYSIDMLKEQAQAFFWPALVGLAAPMLDWRSNPQDLATRIGLDAALRDQISAAFPDVALPAAARTYFCSQLVVAILKIVGLLPVDHATDLTTPTGLHALLAKRGWADVSAAYQCEPDPEYYLGMTPMGTAASLANRRAMGGIAAQQAAWALKSEALRAGIDKMRARCNEILDGLSRKGGTPPAP